MLPNDATEEVLVVEADLGRTTLTFVDVYVPSRRSAPGKSPSRAIAIMEDISKVFDMVSYRLLIELPTPTQSGWMVCGIPPRQRPRVFAHNTIRLPTRCGQSIPSDPSFRSPALFNYFVSDYLITDSDMTSYADDFTLLVSATRINEVEDRANQLSSFNVRKVERLETIDHCSQEIHRNSVHLG